MPFGALGVFAQSMLAVLCVSLIAFAGLFVLSVSERNLRRFVFFLVALSVGALFGDVFFHILLEVFEGGVENSVAGILLSLGVLVFFSLERFLLWNHMHGRSEENNETVVTHEHPSNTPLARIILVADGVHNLLDGVVIGASFLVSPTLGIATTIAVALHEIPQEIADFGVLLHAGIGKGRALFLNFLSALTAFGGVLFVFLFREVVLLVPYALAFAAGGFIYVAGSDLVPELKRETRGWHSFACFAATVLGFAIMYALSCVE